jgi:hypothetical protein
VKSRSQRIVLIAAAAVSAPTSMDEAFRMLGQYLDGDLRRLKGEN